MVLLNSTFSIVLKTLYAIPFHSLDALISVRGGEITYRVVGGWGGMHNVIMRRGFGKISFFKNLGYWLVLPWESEQEELDAWPWLVPSRTSWWPCQSIRWVRPRSLRTASTARRPRPANIECFKHHSNPFISGSSCETYLWESNVVEVKHVLYDVALSQLLRPETVLVDRVLVPVAIRLLQLELALLVRTLKSKDTSGNPLHCHKWLYIN